MKSNATNETDYIISDDIIKKQLQLIDIKKNELIKYFESYLPFCSNDYMDNIVINFKLYLNSTHPLEREYAIILQNYNNTIRIYNNERSNNLLNDKILYLENQININKSEYIKEITKLENQIDINKSEYEQEITKLKNQLSNFQEYNDLTHYRDSINILISKGNLIFNTCMNELLYDKQLNGYTFNFDKSVQYNIVEIKKYKKEYKKAHKKEYHIFFNTLAQIEDNDIPIDNISIFNSIALHWYTIDIIRPKYIEAINKSYIIDYNDLNNYNSIDTNLSLFLLDKFMEARTVQEPYIDIDVFWKKCMKEWL